MPLEFFDGGEMEPMPPTLWTDAESLFKQGRPFAARSKYSRAVKGSCLTHLTHCAYLAHSSSTVVFDEGSASHAAWLGGDPAAAAPRRRGSVVAGVVEGSDRAALEEMRVVLYTLSAPAVGAEQQLPCWAEQQQQEIRFRFELRLVCCIAF